MEARFSQPQRQSQIGILVMFMDTIRHFGRAIWPILLLYVLKFNEINKLWLGLGIGAAFLITSVTAYLKYRNFTFYLDDENEEFIINDGVFNKSKTVIQLNKIQQVNITQSLIQRLINVYSLEVDTAGSTKTEGKIKAVSHELALALKERLLDNEKKRPIVSEESDELVNPVTTSEEKPFIKISFFSLLKVGITSNYIRGLGVILAFFVTIYENIQHLGRASSINTTRLDNYFERYLVIQSIGFVVIFLLVSVLVVNVFRIIFRYFNFTVARQSGSLLLSFGLLNTKSTIVKPEKVQITTVTRNYFQKKMNILELKIKQATSGEKEEKKSAIEIPGCNEKERDAIFKLLFHAIPEKGVMLKPNYRKLGFSIFLKIVVPLAVFFGLSQIDPRISDFDLAVPVYAAFVLLILIFGYRNYRLYINDRFIIKQSGAWDISNEIIEPGKIQALSVSQLFWHKSADIGYLTIYTAGGNVSFQLGNYTVIKNYVNLWLYEMETSDSNWM